MTEITTKRRKGRRGRHVRWFVEGKTKKKTKKKTEKISKLKYKEKKDKKKTLEPTHLITTLTLILHPPLLHLPPNNRNRNRRALYPFLTCITILTFFNLFIDPAEPPEPNDRPERYESALEIKVVPGADPVICLYFHYHPRGRFRRQSGVPPMQMRMGMSVCVPISNRVCVAERVRMGVSVRCR
jgi:hypothetical protein